MAAKTNGSKKTGGKGTTPAKQALIMWALLARENAGAYQKDLKPEPSKEDREALKDADLIYSRKVSRSIWIEVTDKGWAWANANLGHALPANSKDGTEILHRWLVKLEAYMKANGLALADVLGPQSIPQPPLRDRIRAAYLDATGGHLNMRALLKDIRARLADVERRELDAALETMERENEAVLYPLDNHAEITDADRAAAISFAGKPHHILWITK